MSSPVRYPITPRRGDTFRLPVRITHKVEGAFQPVDLTGHQMLAQIRRRPDAPITAEFSFEMGEGDAADGRVTLVLRPEQSRNLATKAVWDFQTVSDEFGTRTWIEGPVEPTLDVSREDEPEPEPESNDG